MVRFLVSTTGAVTSSSVTIAVALSELPLTSVTVRVTVLAPTSPQPKLYLSSVMLAIPQASVEPLSISVASMLAFPVASSWMVMLRVSTTGAVIPSTVTVAVALSVLPLTSVTVRVTALSPTCEQSKSYWLSVMLMIPQEAVEPLSISVAEMLAFPVASSWMLIFLVTTAGAVMPSTVTIAVAVSVLPFTSVTVRFTVLSPTCEQSKSYWFKVIEAIPQESDEPLLISAAVMLALPVVSNWMVMFWVTTTGAVTSSTVTIAVALSVLPFESVMVRVTVLAPTSPQSKLDLSSVMLAIPQESVDPLSMSAAVILALPVVSNWMVMFWVTTAGAVTPSTVTIAVALSVLPFESVTVRVTVLSPTCEQSKSYWLSVMLAIPQVSVEPLSISAAVMLALPVASSWMVMFLVTTTGAVMSSTVTMAVAVSVLPLTSVTVRVTVLSPT